MSRRIGLSTPPEFTGTLPIGGLRPIMRDYRNFSRSGRLMQNKLTSVGITFDDVLLEPAYSEVVPSEVNVSTRLTRRI